MLVRVKVQMRFGTVSGGGVCTHEIHLRYLLGKVPFTHTPCRHVHGLVGRRKRALGKKRGSPQAGRHCICARLWQSIYTVIALTGDSWSLEARKQGDGLSLEHPPYCKASEISPTQTSQR